MNKGQKAVVVGAANLDVLGFAGKTLIPRDSNPGRVRFHAGGVGRNIAENLSRIGVPTSLITAVGEGVDGHFIVDSCRTSGMDIGGIIHTGTAAASAYLAIMDARGDMVLAVSDMETASNITPLALEKRKSLLETAAIIAADANIPEESLEYLAKTFPETPLVVDPVSVTKAERVRSILSGIHILKLNRLEAGALSGRDLITTDDLRHAGSFLTEQGVMNTFITLGSEGVYWFGGGEEGLYRGTACDPVNATGAGDAFTAALIFSTLQNLSIESALHHAAAAARIALDSEAAVNPLMSQGFLKKSISRTGTIERFTD